jgi:hypothetical protein
MDETPNGMEGRPPSRTDTVPFEPPESEVRDLAIGEDEDGPATFAGLFGGVHTPQTNNEPTQAVTWAPSPPRRRSGFTPTERGLLFERGEQGQRAVENWARTVSQEEEASGSSYGDDSEGSLGVGYCGNCPCCVAHLQEIINGVPAFTPDDEPFMENYNNMVLGRNRNREDETGPHTD